MLRIINGIAVDTSYAGVRLVEGVLIGGAGGGGGLPSSIPAGQSNDQMAILYGRTNTENINDAAVRFYTENSAVSGQINDATFESLRAAGNTGTINDMKRSQFGRA